MEDAVHAVHVHADDQDLLLNSTHRAYMPALDRVLRQRGVELTN